MSNNPNRWNPNQELKNLHSHLNRLFEPYGGQNDELMTGSWAPPVDVCETRERIIVRAELPGMRQEDISIEFENGMLTIRGDRKFEKESEEAAYHRVERAYGSFVRSFSLPRTVDSERISAAYRDGILQVNVPKKEEAKPRQIRIDVGK